MNIYNKKEKRKNEGKKEKKTRDTRKPEIK